jgi:tetratricopeptide (TPR) repeat protein
MGDLEAALNDFDAAIMLDKGSAVASLNKSTVLARQNKIEPALSLLDGAIEENPGTALLYLNRGLIREMIGDLSGACEDWNHAKELGAEQAASYIGECN